MWFGTIFGEKHWRLPLAALLLAISYFGWIEPVRALGSGEDISSLNKAPLVQAADPQEIGLKSRSQDTQLLAELNPSKLPNELEVIAASNKKTKSNPTSKKTSSKSSRKAKETALEAASKLPWPENIKKMAGSGAVLVMDNHAGPKKPKELFSLNPDETFVPASILKLVTSAAALEVLGPEYRFATDFYLAPPGDLWIVGRGDPFLVSEEVSLIVSELKKMGLKRVGNIKLDTNYFEPGLILDGTTYTNNPYDAFNVALGVNFNTVTYLIDNKGQIVEFDQWTPLTPITIELAKKNMPKKLPKKNRQYRLNIASSPRQAEEQAGQFFLAQLKKNEIDVSGTVEVGGILPNDALPLYRHINSRNLEELLAVLLEHSNNFMTNQIFLAMGAERFGPPATLAKSQAVIYEYLDSKGLSRLNLVEGSGLSRLNSLTARQMADILAAFEPSRHLVKSRQDGSVLYKTGTMSDISTLAGYLVRPDRPSEPLSFVILLNGAYYPGTREKILDVLKSHFIDEPSGAKG